MLIDQPENRRVSYSNLTTMVFIGIVVMLPILLYSQSDAYTYESYGLGSLVLALWTFLRDPIIQIKNQKMESLSNKHPDLFDRIRNLPAYSKLRNRPDIFYIPDDSAKIFAFGSWRRQYIAISKGAIDSWDNSEYGTNMVVHEIAHITNGDVWKTGFSTHYLFWVFVLFIIDSVRNFPYSMFFTIYRPFRGGLSFYDILIPLMMLLMGFAMLFAIRYMYRMIEFEADKYARENVGLSSYVKIFILTTGKNITSYDRKHISKTSLQEWLFKALSFHPTLQARLSALQSPDYFIKELPGLMFIIGLAVGFVSCFNLELYNSVGIMVAGEVAIGYVALTLSVSWKTGQSFRDWLYLLSVNIASLANGVAIVFSILIGISNLFTWSVEGGDLFRQGTDLTYALFTTVDILLIILVAVPIIVLALVVISWPLGNLVAVKGFTWKSEWFPLASLSPALIICCTYLIRWWGGRPMSPENFIYIFFLCLLWVLAAVFLWRLFSRSVYKKQLKGK